jgi:hypothetical protein
MVQAHEPDLVSRRLTPPQATPTRHSGEQPGLDEAMSRLAMNGEFPFLDVNPLRRLLSWI